MWGGVKDPSYQKLIFLISHPPPTHTHHHSHHNTLPLINLRAGEITKQTQSAVQCKRLKRKRRGGGALHCRGLGWGGAPENDHVMKSVPFSTVTACLMRPETRRLY